MSKHLNFLTRLGTLSSLARSSTGGNDAGSMTSYVVTRFYRAPELVCASGQTRSYDYAIDMWSVGWYFSHFSAVNWLVCYKK